MPIDVLFSTMSCLDRLNMQVYSDSARNQRLLFNFQEVVLEAPVDAEKKARVAKEEHGLLSSGPLVDFKNQLSSNFREKWNSTLRSGYRTVEGWFKKKEPIIITQSDADISEVAKSFDTSETKSDSRNS